MRKVTLTDRLRYWFDNTMAKGTPALVAWLVSAAVAIVALMVLVQQGPATFESIDPDLVCEGRDPEICLGPGYAKYYEEVRQMLPPYLEVLDEARLPVPNRFEQGRPGTPAVRITLNEIMPPAVEAWGVGSTVDLDPVLPHTDVLYLLRVQRERMTRHFFPTTREYARLWGVDTIRFDRLREDAIVMHPGPMNRGVEISRDVADGDRSVITDQVTNGIAVRMALLYLMLGGGDAQPGEDIPVEEVVA
jgi:hypothetical protein